MVMRFLNHIAISHWVWAMPRDGSSCLPRNDTKPKVHKQSAEYLPIAIAILKMTEGKHILAI